jgi:nitrile hydratase accessory protein
LHPPDEPERPFAEPWHAELFATTHALAAAGLFDWPEWAARFSAALAQADADGGPQDGSNYYDVWLAAFEAFLVERGLTDAGRIDALRDAWARAYLSTPHGAPVSLAGDTR